MTAKIKKTITWIIVTLAILASLPVATAAAQQANNNQQQVGVGQCSDKQSFSFFPAWYDNGLCKEGKIVAPNSLAADTATSFSQWITILALNLVSMLLTAVGYVSLGFIIFGGFKYITSGDNASGTAAARKTITNAVIGLVLSIMSVAIVRFIAGAVGGS